MLSIAPEFWPDRVLADRANPRHFFQGKIYTFDQMAELRRDENLGAQASPEVREERYARCQRAIAARKNVVVDTDTCRKNVSNQAVDILNAISAKIQH